MNLLFFCPYCMTRIYDLSILVREANNGTDNHSYYQCNNCGKEFISALTLFELVTPKVENKETIIK